MKQKFYVYVLQNPLIPGDFLYDGREFTAQPFYVGKGSGSRWKEHLRCADKVNIEKNEVIREILDAGMSPIVSFVYYTDEEGDAYAKEEEVISTIGLSRYGGVLVNRTGGGSGCSSGPGHPRYGTNHTPETISKLSEIAQARTPEYYQKIADINRGRKDTPETRQKKSEANRGDKNRFFKKNHSEETKQKMRKRVMSDENKKLLSDLYKGIPLSEERRANMRASAKRGEASPVFGTHKSAEEKARQVMKKAKYRYVVKSSCTTYIVFSLRVFCRYHELDDRAITRSLTGKYTHKGMRLISREPLCSNWFEDQALLSEYNEFAKLYEVTPSQVDYKQAA